MEPSAVIAFSLDVGLGFTTILQTTEITHEIFRNAYSQGCLSHYKTKKEFYMWNSPFLCCITEIVGPHVEEWWNEKINKYKVHFNKY